MNMTMKPRWIALALAGALSAAISGQALAQAPAAASPGSPAAQPQAAADRSALDADEPAWVLSVAGGLAQGPQSIPVGINLGGTVPIRLDGQVQTDRGRATTLSLSRQFWGWESEDRQDRYPLRLELEGLWANVKRTGLNAGVAKATLSDQVDVQGLFLNGLVRVVKTERTQWWLGAGVGRVRQSVDDASAALPGCGCLKAGQGDGTAWRAKLRAEWPRDNAKDDGSALFLEGAVSRMPALTTGNGPTTTYGSWGLKSLTIGWRLRF